MIQVAKTDGILLNPTTRVASHRGSVGSGGLWLIRGALLAAGIELVLLRLFTRTLIHIPGISRVEIPYRAVAELGRFVYYVSVLVVAMALVTLLGRRLPGARADLSTLALALFVGAALAARLDLIADSVLSWAVIGAVLLLLPAATRRFEPRMLPVLLFGMSFAIAGISYLAPTDRSAGSTLSPLFPICEALVLLACFASPLLLRKKPNRAQVLTGLVASVTTFIVMLANPATAKILLLWNFGLAGYFPTVVYATALGVVAVVAFANHSSDPHLSLGLGLLVVGGFGLHSSYQSGLVILGLATIGRADQVAVSGPLAEADQQAAGGRTPQWHRG
jgi:hypothetical protein